MFLPDAATMSRRDWNTLIENPSRQELRTWLAPPYPSINHNIARQIHHDGSATWFIQSESFQEWKKNGSLLWICGKRTRVLSVLPSPSTNPSASQRARERAFFGTLFPSCSSYIKFILSISSTIIEDIKHTQEARSALIAYYYFDSRDVAKHDRRGLLSSLLTQLCDESDRCWDVLSQLYSACGAGSEQPSEAAQARCLRRMLALPGQVPIFIIVDALDECPNTTGTPSPREKVLNLVEDLVLSEHSNLHICVTSRPEHDIQTILDPLAPRRVSLHDEGGQREDIMNYIRSFVNRDRAMRRWRVEDKELVISMLSERANGM